MNTALLIIHGLVAVALLGAITHQTIAAWVPTHGQHGSFLRRFRRVPSGSFTNAIVVLYAVSALLGAVLYLPFRAGIRPDLERAGQWQALGFFDLKEHFVAIGFALLPARVCWQQQRADEPSRTPAALTLVLAFIVWWSFLIGHVLNNIMGFGL